MEASASRILVKESLIVRQTKRYILPAFPEVENLGHGGMGRSWVMRRVVIVTMMGKSPCSPTVAQMFRRTSEGPLLRTK